MWLGVKVRLILIPFQFHSETFMGVRETGLEKLTDR